MTDTQYYQSLFNSHVKIDDAGCYLWQAAKNNIGYGMFRYDGKMRTAHRVAMHFDGHDIDNKVVYHLCDNYNCVNTDHLRIGTLKDKSQVMASKGRAGLHWKDVSRHKTCPHCGHTNSPAVIGHYHNDKCEHKP